MNDGTGRQEEPQSERGAPGSRDMGSTGPGGGPADRPAGAFEDDEMISVDPGDAGSHRPGHTTTVGDADAAVPPYEGRTERGDVRPAGRQGRGEHRGCRTAGGRRDPQVGGALRDPGWRHDVADRGAARRVSRHEPR